MWDEFYKEIDGKKFKTRDEFNSWVKGWAETMCGEAGRIERFALSMGDGDAHDELNVDIGENVIYELEYRYSDEDQFHNANACVYTTGTRTGDEIQEKLDAINDGGDFEPHSELDILVNKLFGINDGDICFYFDRNTIPDDELKKRMELSYDIVIKDMWVK